MTSRRTSLNTHPSHTHLGIASDFRVRNLALWAQLYLLFALLQSSRLPVPPLGYRLAASTSFSHCSARSHQGDAHDATILYALPSGLLRRDKSSSLLPTRGDRHFPPEGSDKGLSSATRLCTLQSSGISLIRQRTASRLQAIPSRTDESSRTGLLSCHRDRAADDTLL